MAEDDAVRERFVRSAEQMAARQDARAAERTRARAGVDLVPELLELARPRAEGLANVLFVEGDVTRLEFERGSFDLAGTLRTLHHVRRPELVVAELARVTRPGGRVLVIDQLAPIDPLEALELDRFERARDPSHTRCLPDVDLRHLFEAESLHFEHRELDREPRALDPYLDLAGCEGEERARATALAPPGYTAETAWYLLRRA